MTVQTGGGDYRDRARVSAAPPAAAFDVLDRRPGYFNLHPGISLRFQLNRWLAWMTPQAAFTTADISALGPG